MLSRLSGLFSLQKLDQKHVRSTVVFKGVYEAEEALLQPHKNLVDEIARIRKAIYAMYPHPIPNQANDEINSNSRLLALFNELIRAREAIKAALHQDERCALTVYYYGLLRKPFICYMKMGYVNDEQLCVTQVVFCHKYLGWNYVWYRKNSDHDRWLKDSVTTKLNVLQQLAKVILQVNADNLIQPSLAQKSTDIILMMSELSVATTGLVPRR